MLDTIPFAALAATMARIIAVLMLIALPAAFAFPQFWVGENKAAGTCSKHPTGPGEPATMPRAGVCG